MYTTRVEYYYKNSQHRNQNIIDYDMMGYFISLFNNQN